MMWSAYAPAALGTQHDVVFHDGRCESALLEEPLTAIPSVSVHRALPYADPQTNDCLHSEVVHSSREEFAVAAQEP